mmetsp:Transcript_15659/g.26727  ORF Transcript_15659/g.26727 Transcript_15659/m.26727 type:complete len:198 (-) Transcript_15659:187-780(-)
MNKMSYPRPPMSTIIVREREIEKMKSSRNRSSAKEGAVYSDSVDDQTLTVSYWDDGKTMGSGTFATDDETFANSLESWGTEDEQEYRRQRARRRNKGLASGCGDGIADASNVLVESLLNTTRALSQGVKNTIDAGVRKSVDGVGVLSKAKAKHDKERKDKLEREAEEKRMELEEQARKDMLTSRYEVGHLANMWREK